MYKKNANNALTNRLIKNEKRNPSLCFKDILCHQISYCESLYNRISVAYAGIACNCASSVLEATDVMYYYKCGAYADLDNIMREYRFKYWMGLLYIELKIVILNVSYLVVHTDKAVLL